VATKRVPRTDVSEGNWDAGVLDVAWKTLQPASSTTPTASDAHGSNLEPPRTGPSLPAGRR